MIAYPGHPDTDLPALTYGEELRARFDVAYAAIFDELPCTPQRAHRDLRALRLARMLLAVTTTQEAA